MFAMRGDPRFSGQRSVAQLPADDYSYLIKDGATISHVVCIYGKGTYGAYAIPVGKTTVIDEPQQPGDYTLTEADKQEIADMVDVPTDEHINDLINTALGVIENGTY